MEQKQDEVKYETEQQEVDDPQLDGVLVQLVPGQNEGDRQVVVTPLGDVKATEAPTILRLAAKGAEGNLGL